MPRLRKSPVKFPALQVLGVLMFGGMSLYFFWQATAGIAVGEVLAIEKRGPSQYVSFDADPGWYVFFVSLHGLLGVAFLALSVWIAANILPSLAAEERYFRQKELLEPDKD